MPGQADADDAAYQQAAALFQQMLGTTADPATLAAKPQALAGGASPQDLCRQAAHSDAAKAAVNGFYRDVLGVDADPGVLANVEAALGAGQPQAQAEAALRPQFAQLASAEASIQALYQQVLGRDADLGGLTANTAALAGGATPDQLRSGLAHSDEAGRDLNVFYQEVLGRNADAGGLANFENAPAGGLPLACPPCWREGWQQCLSSSFVLQCPQMQARLQAFS